MSRKPSPGIYGREKAQKINVRALPSCGAHRRAGHVAEANKPFVPFCG
jgi:hypothetical protein